MQPYKIMNPSYNACTIDEQNQINSVIDYLAALALHNSLELEEVIFKMNIHPTVDSKGMISCDVSALEAMEETDKENVSTMELIFKRNAPSEGIARLYTDFCKTI